MITMEIKKIIEELDKKVSQKAIRSFISQLKFEARFNTLRELIYHVDLYLSENNYAHANQLLNVIDKITRYLDQDYEDYKTRDVRALKVIARKKKAKFFENQGLHQEAENQYKAILKDLKLPDEENFLAEMLMELGIIEEQGGNKKEALSKFDQSSKIYGKRQDNFNYEAALFNCAHVLYDLSFYDKAEEFCQAVIKHHQDVSGKMVSPIAHSYLELANVYEVFDCEDKAKTHYKKALDSYRQLNDRIKMSDILNRIGSYEVEDGNILSAAAIFQEALDIKRTMDFIEGKAIFYDSMGDQMRWSGCPEEALNYYNAAFHYFEEAGADGRKLLIKHKIYKILDSLQTTQKDMGTFFEKFQKKGFETTKITPLERLDYARHSVDVEEIQANLQWNPGYRFRVNRKFLIYVLRNLSRVYSILGKKKDFLLYSRLRAVVEEDYRKGK
jgi:tetratricopeptide (TPR) repeat protein